MESLYTYNMTYIVVTAIVLGLILLVGTAGMSSGGRR